MKDLSVCMASYNGEQFIGRQITSILSQLSSNDELIISDDGSEDNTISIIQSFNDNRITLCLNTGRRGPVGNFENAMKKAQGQIIFLADQDDFWLPGKVDKHVNGHARYDLVISDCRVVTENGNVLFDSFFKARKSGKGLLKNILRNSYIGCCMSFDRRILNVALPFPNMIHMHDWWVGLVAELKGTVYFHEEPLMEYMRHSKNASPTLSISGFSRLEQLKNRLQLITYLMLRSLRRI